ncbi:MAG: deoxyribose-phosphate aldolase [Oscillospiraceae bacterium]|nr:deoxyribose-phosphate aldolase [Oscillospiraceae bacterium]
MNASVIETRIYETIKTYDALKCLCYEAKELGMQSVQVFPCMIKLCRGTLKGSGVAVNALISYPHGGFTIDQKATEAKEAVNNGADMVEVVVNTREIKSHNYGYIAREMRAVREAVPTATVKFNIEIESLTDEEAAETCKVAVESGIDIISTSTGLYHTLDENKNDVPLVTSVHEVELLKKAADGKLKIQAEGYISTPEIAEKLLSAGADIISTEYAAAVLK